MNKCHPNIKLTTESEIDNTLPYVAILIIRHPNVKLTTKVNMKLYTILISLVLTLYPVSK